MKALAWLGLTLALSGCLSTKPEQWSRSGEDTARQRDIYECRADAEGVGYRGIAFGGAVMPLIGLFHARSTFNDCMASRGWAK